MPRGRRKANQSALEVPQEVLHFDANAMNPMYNPPEDPSGYSEPTYVARDDNDYMPSMDTSRGTEDSNDTSLATEDDPTARRRGRGRGRGGGRGRGRAGRPSMNRLSITDTTLNRTVEDSNSLFESVRGGRSALQSVVDEWIESYRQDREAAILELMQFFIRSSGCKGKITPHMRESLDNG
ncbi:unnamed protein product, partial [Oppiella nova]